MPTETKAKGGLEDVVATTSTICALDGERGLLAYCGYDIHDLAPQASFEETCYLLWHGRLPTRAELGDLQSQLAAARPLPEAMLRLVRSLPRVGVMRNLRRYVLLEPVTEPVAKESFVGAVAEVHWTTYGTYCTKEHTLCSHLLSQIKRSRPLAGPPTASERTGSARRRA